MLSHQLPVYGLVCRYHTNYLIGRRPILERLIFPLLALSKQSVSGISSDFSLLSRTQGQVTHVLLSRRPLGNSPEGETSFDLHALGAPPAFVLSQDQTLL